MTTVYAGYAKQHRVAGIQIGVDHLISLGAGQIVAFIKTLPGIPIHESVTKGITAQQGISGILLQIYGPPAPSPSRRFSLRGTLSTLIVKLISPKQSSIERLVLTN